MDNPSLLEKAIALYQQEQQQKSTPECLHDFDYDSSYGQKVCFNCGVIDPSPLLITTTELSYYRPTSKPDKTVYLKKCIAEHEEQYNCTIPYNMSLACGRLLLAGCLTTFLKSKRLSTSPFRIACFNDNNEIRTSLVKL